MDCWWSGLESVSNGDHLVEGISCQLVFQTVPHKYEVVLLTPSFRQVSGFPCSYRALIQEGQLHSCSFLQVQDQSGSGPDSCCIMKQKEVRWQLFSCLVITSTP